MAFRAASSWGAVVVLVGGSFVASAGCGGSSSSGTSPMAQGGCADCGGAAAGAAVQPEGGVPAGAGGGSASDAGAAAQAGAPTEVTPELTLRALTISQTLEVPLMADGRAVLSAERSVPLIAGKRALLRALVDVDARFEPRSLIGVLDITSQGRSHSVVSERNVSEASRQDDLASSFVFDVAAEDLTAESSYRVRVLEADTTPLTRFPEDGYAAFAAEELPAFRLVLVPFVANGFAPNTGEAALEALRNRLVALYPSRDVQLSVASAVTLSYEVDADGAGWDDALDLIYELRAKAAPEHDAFFYGLLAPAASFDSYCVDGCLLGYSIVADERDEAERGSIGVGIFPDGSGHGDAEDTAAHELGHALGRDHAPCGISDPGDTDPAWPEDSAHRNGLIGRYGYDFDLARLVKPRPAKDVMSYCTPVWISDYSYRGIFERLKAIASQKPALQGVQLAETLRVARIRRTGDSRWLAPKLKPGARLASSAALLDAEGKTLGTVPARFVRVDHGRGGYVWLPENKLHVPGTVSVDLRPFGGAVLSL